MSLDQVDRLAGSNVWVLCRGIPRAQEVDCLTNERKSKVESVHMACHDCDGLLRVRLLDPVLVSTDGTDTHALSTSPGQESGHVESVFVRAIQRKASSSCGSRTHAFSLERGSPTQRSSHAGTGSKGSEVCDLLLRLGSRQCFDAAWMLCVCVSCLELLNGRRSLLPKADRQ